LNLGDSSPRGQVNLSMLMKKDHADSHNLIRKKKDSSPLNQPTFLKPKKRDRGDRSNPLSKQKDRGS